MCVVVLHGEGCKGAVSGTSVPQAARLHSSSAWVKNRVIVQRERILQRRTVTPSAIITARQLRVCVGFDSIRGCNGPEEGAAELEGLPARREQRLA